MTAHKCTGFKERDVLNGNDKVIGAQCSVCLVVLYGIGTCHGCGKEDTRLRFVVGEELRYCGPECRTAELQRARGNPGPVAVRR